MGGAAAASGRWDDGGTAPDVAPLRLVPAAEAVRPADDVDVDVVVAEVVPLAVATSAEVDEIADGDGGRVIFAW
jgi:hypothetical protein